MGIMKKFRKYRRIIGIIGYIGGLEGLNVTDQSSYRIKSVMRMKLPRVVRGTAPENFEILYFKGLRMV